MTDNEVIVDSVRYMAVDETDRCTGCAGVNPNSALCLSLPDCEAWVRKDGRDIVWQRDPSATDELTSLRELNRELVEALETACDRLGRMGLATKLHRAIIAKARGEK